MLEIEHNTIPAGTRIVLTLDTGENDYVTSITGEVFNRSGAQIGTRVTCSLIGQPTWKGQSPTGPKLKESNLAPLGAFQVVVVGPPSGHAHFKAGLGTITVTAKPSVAADLHWPDPEGEATGETSNIYYGKVQDGQHGHIVQPFGVPSPRITGVSGLFEVTGSGLYPNSKLHAKAHFSVPDAPQIPGEPNPVGLTSEADGTFALPVKPEDASIFYNGDAGTFEATVTDADGNWAAGTCRWDAISFFSSVKLPVEDAKSGLRH